MAGDILKTISDLRFTLDTETDHASPDGEVTYGAIRKAIEALFLLLLGTGASGTLTSDPPDDTTGFAIDTAAGFADDEHNGRTLVFTDGLAIGEKFTIDDTEAANNRVECAGDNLYNAGARSGDSYIILHDVLVNEDGHDHDGVNSAPVVLPDGSNVIVTRGDDMTPLSDNTEAWTTQVSCKVYIPKNASVLRMVHRTNQSGTGSSNLRFFLYDGADYTYSDNVNISNAAYTWYTTTFVPELDASELDEGWYTLGIQFSNINTSNSLNLQGYTIAWFAEELS